MHDGAPGRRVVDAAGADRHVDRPADARRCGMTQETSGTSTAPVDETAAVAAAIVATAVPTEPPTDRGPRIGAGWSTGVRWLVAVLGRPDPVQRLRARQRRRPGHRVRRHRGDSTLTQPGQFQQIILTRPRPIALAGLAVVVPARAGLVNVGGEGQLDHRRASAPPRPPLWLGTLMSPCGRDWSLMMLSAAVAGALWAGHRRRAAARRQGQRGGHHAAAQLHRADTDARPDLRTVEGPGRLGQPTSAAS